MFHINSFKTRLIGLYRSTINSKQRFNWCFISGFPRNALFNIYIRGLYCVTTEEAKVLNIYFHFNKISYRVRKLIISQKQIGILVVLCVLPWEYTMYKIMKKCTRKKKIITVQRDTVKLATLGHNDKRYPLTSKFCPQGLCGSALRLNFYIS